MLPRSLHFLLLSVLVLFATGCAEVTISSPEGSTIYTEPPAEFSVSWENDILGNGFKAFLNGENVTASFTQAGSTATVAGVDLAAYLKHGENVFSVSSPAARLVSFTMDLEGPIVHITNTESVGGNLSITGYLDDPSEVVSLSYTDSNGGSGGIPLTGNAFSALIPESNPISITFNAEDILNQTSETTFYRDSGGLIGNTLGARINASALDFANAVAPDLLADLDLIGVLAAQGTIWSETLLGLFDASLVIREHPNNSLEISQVDLALSASSYDLDVGLVAENIDIAASVCMGANFFPLNLLPDVCQDGSLIASRVDIGTRIDIGNSNGAIVINEIDIVQEEVDFQGIQVAFNVFNIGDWEITLPAANIFDALAETLIGLIGGLLNGPLTDAVADILADLPMEFDIQLDVGNGVREVTAEGYFNNFEKDANSLLLMMGTTLTTSTPADVPDPLGVRTFGSATTPDSAAPSGTEYDFSMSLSSTFMNHLLDTVYRAGMLALTVDLAEGTQGFSGMRITVDPAAPPFVSVNDNALGMGSLSLHDFSMRVETKVSAEAEYELLFAATINMTAPFDVIPVDERHLGVDISTLVNIDVISVDEQGATPVSAELVDTIVTLGAPVVIPSVSQVLSNIELPSILGLSVSVQEIWSDQPTGTFLVAGDLLSVEEMAALNESE